MKITGHRKSAPLQRLLRPILVGLALLFAIPFRVGASEKSEFETSLYFFQNKIYLQAESRFAGFTQIYTNSTYLSEALYYQALSRYHLANYSGALEILQSKLGTAGNIADQYQFWMAQSLAGTNGWRQAAEGWSQMIKEHPDSGLHLAASYSYALAFSKLNEWQTVIELLGKPDGDFQTTARKQSQTDLWAINGYLLLSDAYYHEKQYADAEKVLMNIPESGSFARSRQIRLCHIQMITGRAQEALANAASLPAISVNDQQKAESFALIGEIHESLGQLTNAISTYANNLAPAIPTSFQRTALLKIIELNLKLDKADQAIAFLADFIEKRPANDPSMDIACLSLGELKLKAFNPTAPAATNLLQQAMTNFTRVIVESTNPMLRGKAYLGLGWCYWNQTNMLQASINFSNAVELITTPEDRTVARFKLADTQFSQNNYGAAIVNYTNVLNDCDKSPQLKSNLYNKALYQVLRAAIEQNDAKVAGTAITNITEWYPETLGFFTDECLLLYGEFQTRTNGYIGARKTFNDLIAKFPNTEFMPEVQYAIARTYVQEGDWSSAVACFDSWVTNYPAHPLLPQAEFSRALASDKAGLETNCLNLFTNFVARFPSNNLAPWAQNWVADYYFNHDSFINADRSYKELVQMLQTRNFSNVGDLAYQARYMIGRSTLAHEEFGEAGKNFASLVSDLIKDTNAAPSLIAQTWYALGETSYKQFLDPAGSTNIISLCNDAVYAFSQITNGTRSISLAPLAMSRIGDCNLQWHKLNTNYLEALTNAMSAFEAVVTMEKALQKPEADASVANQAEVNLGLIQERLGNLDEALGHYLNVILEADSSRQDPLWVKEAGVHAARLCKSRGMWEKAVTVYDCVMKVIPSLRPSLEVEKAKALSQAVKK